MQLEAQLTEAGVSAAWDPAHAAGPAAGAGDSADGLRLRAVVLDADHLGARLPSVASAWRALPALPGLVAIGGSPEARASAPGAQLTLLSPTARTATIASALRDAVRLRATASLSWPMLRAAARLPAEAEEPAAWPQALAAARAIAPEVPRAALRWRAGWYATPTAKLDELVAERWLSVPERAAAERVDGTRTIQRLVHGGPLDPDAAARALWALACMGAVELTAEVRDRDTPARRRLAEVRAHLRRRAARLEGATYYDVLEVTPLAEHDELEAAYAGAARSFAPAALAEHDLGDAAGLVAPLWELTEKARAVLIDDAARGRYHDWLRRKLPALRTVWAVDPPRAAAAAAAYARGQIALGDGDVHRAMSELAGACRQHPGHPEYEASLAWARLRVQVASGRDQGEAARSERAYVEELLLGGRAWPRALVALALLCVTAGDAPAARWHLHAALRVDPRDPAAARLARRLGLPRA